MGTSRSSCKREKFELEKVGRPSISPEKVIVDIVVAMAKIHHPLCVQKIVELANSIIESTDYEDRSKRVPYLQRSNWGMVGGEALQARTRHQKR
jgi:hypothetical protein